MADRAEAAKALAAALAAAMPCFDPYRAISKAATSKPKHQRKSWHVPAILVMDAITRAAVTSGHKVPSLARYSPAVLAAYRALCRMGHKPPSREAVSQLLIRWHERYGRRL
jgi:hypothetical protein